jgi:predicted nucleotide-binding protein
MSVKWRSLIRCILEAPLLPHWKGRKSRAFPRGTSQPSRKNIPSCGAGCVSNWEIDYDREAFPDPNKVPVVFIGSSSRQTGILNAIARAIKSRNLKVRKWTKGVFGLSATTIESLERTIASSDFAVIILSGDDTTEQRGLVKKSPRDNCIFELGLGMGALGRERSFILKEKGALHLPADLDGVTYHQYHPARPDRLKKDIKAAGSKIKARINETENQVAGKQT